MNIYEVRFLMAIGAFLLYAYMFFTWVQMMALYAMKGWA